MTDLILDLGKTAGPVKHMNAVNNGPVSPGVRESYTNFDTYRVARIPYARNHDASFYSGYGGEHTVDVHRIFRNFDADETDPENYIFEPTDDYVANTFAVGTKVFYRLGAQIEHEYKFGTRVPRDFAKWARICEHIIRHYTEGWANGFLYDIEYWEIWNEPDCRNANGSNPCWQGTEEQFIELYITAAMHLKKCFPDKKIGGPAFCSIWSSPFVENFLDRVAQDNVPLDFLSYHWYGKEFLPFSQSLERARALLDERGLTDTETILNEWNYVKGWRGADWKETIRTEKNHKGASFITAAMCLSQSYPLDMLMYYDARPLTVMNGMFAFETFAPLKGYYPFYAFSDLKDLGTSLSLTPSAYDLMQDGIYAAAARDEDGKLALLITYYRDEADTPAREITLTIKGSPQNLTAYVLDEEHDLTPAWTKNTETPIRFTLPLYTTLLLKSE